MSPHCDDETNRHRRSGVATFRGAKRKGDKSPGRASATSLPVNGVRVTVEDGTWGWGAPRLTAELVVVVESPVRKRACATFFKAVDAVLRTHPEVGEYNQTSSSGTR